jgi:hypothetical protein
MTIGAVKWFRSSPRSPHLHKGETHLHEGQKVAFAPVADRQKGKMSPGKLKSISGGEGAMLELHEMQERVLNELYFDLAIPRDRVSVGFQNGCVILSGEVEWPYQKTCAEADVRRVPGVTVVANEIAVDRTAVASRAESA